MEGEKVVIACFLRAGKAGTAMSRLMDCDLDGVRDSIQNSKHEVHHLATQHEPLLQIRFLPNQTMRKYE